MKNRYFLLQLLERDAAKRTERNFEIIVAYVDLTKFNNNAFSMWMTIFKITHAIAYMFLVELVLIYIGVIRYFCIERYM